MCPMKNVCQSSCVWSLHQNETKYLELYYFRKIFSRYCCYYLPTMRGKKVFFYVVLLILRFMFKKKKGWSGSITELVWSAKLHN